MVRAFVEAADLKVNTLHIENNAGSVEATFGPSQWLLHCNIQNNAGSVKLDVPTGHAVRIVATASLSSSNLEGLGLKPVAGGLQSPDWEHNEKRCDIVLVQNVASFELVWKRSKGEGIVEVMETPAGVSENGAIPSGEL